MGGAAPSASRPRRSRVRRAPPLRTGPSPRRRPAQAGAAGVPVRHAVEGSSKAISGTSPSLRRSAWRRSTARAAQQHGERGGLVRRRRQYRTLQFAERLVAASDGAFTSTNSLASAPAVVTASDSAVTSPRSPISASRARTTRQPRRAQLRRQREHGGRCLARVRQPVHEGNNGGARDGNLVMLAPQTRHAHGLQGTQGRRRCLTLREQSAHVFDRARQRASLERREGHASCAPARRRARRGRRHRR